MLHLTLGDPNLIANFETAMVLKGCGFMDEEINALYYEQLVKDRVQDEVLVRMLLDDTTAAIERELKNNGGQTMSLNELAKEIHENAVAHGWWEKERSFGEIVALCHSELSEALEEFRDGHPLVWYRCMKNPKPNDQNCEMCPFDHDGTCDVPELELKPEGIAVELIDCMIRILDYLGKEQVDVDKLLQIKHEYNKGRPYLHGGKKL